MKRLLILLALDRARALPKFELADRRSVIDAALSADGRFAFLTVTERAQPKSAEVPRWVNESGYTEIIPTPPRAKMGDAQDHVRMAVLNLESGEEVWSGPDGVADPIAIPKPPFGDEPRVTAQTMPHPPRLQRQGSATCGGRRPRCRRTVSGR